MGKKQFSDSKFLDLQNILLMVIIIFAAALILVLHYGFQPHPQKEEPPKPVELEETTVVESEEFTQQIPRRIQIKPKEPKLKK